MKNIPLLVRFRIALGAGEYPHRAYIMIYNKSLSVFPIYLFGAMPAIAILNMMWVDCYRCLTLTSSLQSLALLFSLLHTAKFGESPGSTRIVIKDSQVDSGTSPPPPPNNNLAVAWPLKKSERVVSIWPWEGANYYHNYYHNHFFRTWRLVDWRSG